MYKKHICKKSGLALMLSGILAVGSLFPAFAETVTFNAPGSTTEGTSTEQTTGTTSATAETSGTIHAGSTQVETGGPGMPTQSASTTEAAPDGVTTNAPDDTTEIPTTTDSTSTETSAFSEVSSDGNALTDAQGAELEAERAAAEAEAQEDSNNPLKVPQREPHLQTTVLLIADGMTWSNPYVNDQQIEGASAGFSSISTFLENIHGDLLYRVYNSQTGWTGWAMNGQQTAGASNPIPVEAIQYRFAGIVGDQFDIYYSTILSDGTQTGWAKNGESAGSMNKGLYITGYRLAFFRKGTNGAEALDTTNALVSDHSDGIQIVDGAMRYIHGDGSNYTGWGWQGSDRYYFKDSVPVTGWQYIDGLKYYFQEDGKLLTDVESVLGSDGPYLLKVNKEMNCLTVYAQDGGNGYIIPVKSFLTSVGDDTPIGTFKTPEKYRWRLMIHDVYTQYATRLGAGLPILLHSIIYDAPNSYSVWASTYNNMGIARSAGCIRLVSGDAKWIYDHCPIGTTVTVYNSEIAGPFERPTIKEEIPFEQTWDPTDPNVTEEGIAQATQQILAKFAQQ